MYIEKAVTCETIFRLKLNIMKYKAIFLILSKYYNNSSSLIIKNTMMSALDITSSLIKGFVE